ncbi:MAG: alpha/beta hydrolase [Candidatus Abyssobacteria bacterium SURF_17]|uniref:Alpha/beta hydrolase n=1 Tax=Candidatus Abyssobacteria bacterium SURF_17 TaxID=2093361 RepID=A0A419ESS6_9BACT|nr:MAG: alpha/beta hydrolase [Candidatus Abyssubacteria bacterium SURF_17]
MTVIRVNDVNLNYEPSGKGEAIVFLHGYTGNSQDWANQIPLVSARCRAIAIDHRGHGKSEAPAMEEAYSIKTFSEDVYALLSKLGITRCCLVGHSMGGFMALQLVLDHPEIVKAMVLVDTSSGEFEVAPGYAELRAKLDELARAKGMKAAFEYDAAHNPVRIERFKRHPELREVTRRKMMNTSVDGYVHVAKTFGKWQPVTGRLGEIQVPVLIFLGEEDTGFIRASQILKEGIRGSELITVQGVGHSPHEEAPQVFNEAFLRFLSKIIW